MSTSLNTKLDLIAAHNEAIGRLIDEIRDEQAKEVKKEKKKTGIGAAVVAMKHAKLKSK